MAQIPTPIQLDSKSPNKASISPRDYAMGLIINSYRRKVLARYPKASFDTHFVLGISTNEWADILESTFSEFVSWETYGRNWQVYCIKDASHFDMESAEEFYQYFHYTNFAVKKKVAKGFMADPNSVSPLDRDGDQV